MVNGVIANPHYIPMLKIHTNTWQKWTAKCKDRPIDGVIGNLLYMPILIIHTVTLCKWVVKFKHLTNQ